MQPIRIGSDLTARLGGVSVTLTPTQGLRLAEDLIRKSTRKMMAEEAVKPPYPGREAAAQRSLQ